MARKKRVPAAAAASVVPLALAFLQGVQPATTPAFPPTAETLSHPVGVEAIYPLPDQTPGFANPDITQQNIADTICNPKWSTSSIRPPASYTTALKEEQMAGEYGDTVDDPDKQCMPNSNNKACYEEDHLISLEVGGHPRDPRNLWPEAYDTTVNGHRVGAREKDTVENYIHDAVCFDVPESRRGSRVPPHASITLQRGQQILATDWYGCYLSLQQGQDCK